MDDKSKKLFTPGPLLTKVSVREQMLIDLGSRDTEFTSAVDFVRNKLLEIAGVSQDEFVSVIMQGSGTFGNEAVIQTITPRDSPAKFLILENGAYGIRLKKICDLIGIDCSIASFPEERALDVEQIEKFIERSNFTHVGVIHNETTSGVLNPIEKIGQLIKKHLPGIVKSLIRGE